jgi:hypothetical protein
MIFLSLMPVTSLLDFSYAHILALGDLARHAQRSALGCLRYPVEPEFPVYRTHTRKETSACWARPVRQRASYTTSKRTHTRPALPISHPLQDAGKVD